MSDCVFCQIVDGSLDASKEYEDEFAVAFRSIKPITPTHVLVIPKKHIINLETADDIEALGHVQMAIGKVVNKLGLQEGYKLGVNSGKFQEVKHLHYHVLAGFENPESEI